MGTHLKSWGLGTETRQINIPRLVVSAAFHWPCPQTEKILTATAMPSDRLAGVRSRTQRSGLWTFWYRTRKQDVAFGKTVLRTVSLANVDQLTCLGWMESSFHSPWMINLKDPKLSAFLRWRWHRSKLILMYGVIVPISDSVWHKLLIIEGVTPRKTNMTMENLLKMYLLFKMVSFHCHVGFQGGTTISKNTWQNHGIVTKTYQNQYQLLQDFCQSKVCILLGLQTKQSKISTESALNVRFFQEWILGWTSRRTWYCCCWWKKSCTNVVYHIICRFVFTSQVVSWISEPSTVVSDHKESFATTTWPQHTWIRDKLFGKRKTDYPICLV